MVTFSMVLSVMSPYVHAEEPYSAISGEIIEEVQEENLQDEEIGTLNVNEGEDLSLSGEEDEEKISVSSFSQDYTIPGNENPDEMLNAYIEKRIDQLQNPVYMASDFAGNNLEGANRVFYNLIKRKITGIVYGGDTDVIVCISYSDLGLEKQYYTAAELGVDKIKNENQNMTEEAEEAILHKYGFDSLDLESVMTAVKADCPLETFWMGLDVNFGYGYSIVFGDTVAIGIDQIGVCLSINSSYRNSYGTFDSQKMQRIQTAITNIDDILDTAKNKNDRDKMDYYRDKICQLTEYNHPAAQWDKSMYGDPWQLIYVFDG
ncbi:MAG: hypothetical protein K5776_13165 [Lachnospiraceae bacterium]|nr:hypothetical protein [Lachnospiraceae bacterium]